MTKEIDMDTKVVDKARQIIETNRFLSLATCSNNKVWAAAIAYVVDEEYNFYFYSALDSLHMQHIKNHPEVAFTIFSSNLIPEEADGLQIAGIVGQVEKHELSQVVNFYYNQMFPDPEVRAKWQAPYEHFLKNEFPFQRFFRIVPSEIFKLDNTVLEVDRRLEIKINELKQKPAKLPTLSDFKVNK